MKIAAAQVSTRALGRMLGNGFCVPVVARIILRLLLATALVETREPRVALGTARLPEDHDVDAQGNPEARYIWSQLAMWDSPL